MCCGDDEALDLPPAVIEMLARYRALRDEHGWDWGGEEIDMFRWARFSRLGDVYAAFEQLGDWGRAVRTVVGLDPPAGIVLVRSTDDGLDVRCGPPRPVMPGATVPLDVVLDGPAGVSVETVDAGPEGATVTVDGTPVSLGAALRPVPAARLRLRSPRCARWSVTDDTGGAWFPDGVPHKWDVNDRPFFHAADVVLDVPSTPLTVVCARGLEFGQVTKTLTPDSSVVDADPPRLFDPAAAGWYGGDLHVHLNYSGDLVCAPADAARMQYGEGLHLVSLVAGNCQTSRVYDRELLEAYAGQDLPWSTGDTVARAGVEYRNDLLGHVHALGPDSAPDRFFTGHERSDHPEDWPPNHIACADLRHRHATVGYAHPVRSTMDAFFDEPRSVEARELVVDAALGLVDSLDVLSPFNDEGAVDLYHRLLSCGLRLTATAGTDTFLSFAHGPGTASNPPGWARVYAHLGGEPLSVAAFQDAIRAGRTVVTNGPWLTLTVGGHLPGTVLNARPGERLDVTASVIGDCRLTLEGPDGVLASSDGGPLSVSVPVTGPTWLAAVARGPAGPATLDRAALAHTTPVYVDVDGARVARAEAVDWCLRLIDGLATLIEEHGRFDPMDRALRVAQYRALLDRGRQYYRLRRLKVQAWVET
jgi:hypothetical protein